MRVLSILIVLILNQIIYASGTNCSTNGYKILQYVDTLQLLGNANVTFKRKCLDDIARFAFSKDRNLTKDKVDQLFEHRRHLLNTRTKECQDNAILRQLRLNFNRIRLLYPDMFRCIPNMELMDVSHNNITILYLLTFRNNLKLKNILLHDNKIFYFGYYNDIYRGFNFLWNEINANTKQEGYQFSLNNSKVDFDEEVGEDTLKRNLSNWLEIDKHFHLASLPSLECLRLDGNRIKDGEFLQYSGRHGTSNLIVNLQRNFINGVILDQELNEDTTKEHLFTHDCECQIRFLYERFTYSTAAGKQKLVNRLVVVDRCHYKVNPVITNLCPDQKNQCTLHYGTSKLPCKPLIDAETRIKNVFKGIYLYKSDFKFCGGNPLDYNSFGDVFREDKSRANINTYTKWVKLKTITQNSKHENNLRYISIITLAVISIPFVTMVLAWVSNQIMSRILDKLDNHDNKYVTQ